MTGLSMALAQLEDIPSRLEVTAERALLARLNAGCSAPIGGLSRCVDEPDGGVRLRLDTVVCAPDGSDVQRAGEEITMEAGLTREAGMDAAAKLGTRVAETLLAEDRGLLKHVIDT